MNSPFAKPYAGLILLAVVGGLSGCAAPEPDAAAPSTVSPAAGAQISSRSFTPEEHRAMRERILRLFPDDHFEPPGTPVVNPVALSTPPPKYPPAAGMTGTEGEVILAVMVSKKGQVSKVGLLKPGNPVLAKAATDAVMKWKYRPGLVNGKKDDVTIIVPFRFVLINDAPPWRPKTTHAAEAFRQGTKQKTPPR